MASQADRAHVRLAELVAALSIGIDLGFGQPMEHVLRQCLIALRLAEGLGLDEEERAVVYYTALLVNVGCHSDAHEQAKWFGDDIAMKAGKYDHELRSLRSNLAGLRMLGAGTRHRRLGRPLRRRPPRRGELRGPEVAVLPGPRARGERAGRRGGQPAGARRRGGPHAEPRRPRPRLRPARRLERRARQARPALRGRSRAPPSPAVSHRADAAPVGGAGADGRDRRPAPGAARRLRPSARAVRRGHLPTRARAGGRGRLSGDARAASAPGGAYRGGGRGGAARGGEGGPPRRRRLRGGPWGGGPPRAPGGARAPPG
jgi:hypothetical protein